MATEPALPSVSKNVSAKAVDCPLSSVHAPAEAKSSELARLSTVTTLPTTHVDGASAAVLVAVAVVLVGTAVVVMVVEVEVGVLDVDRSGVEGDVMVGGKVVAVDVVTSGSPTQVKRRASTMTFPSASDDSSTEPRSLLCIKEYTPKDSMLAGFFWSTTLILKPPA